MNDFFELVESKDKDENEIISLLRDKNKNYYIMKEVADKHHKNTLVNEINVLNVLKKYYFVPKVRDYNFDGNEGFIILDYMDGKNVSEIKFKNIKEKFYFMIKLIECISLIHKKNIIHADLKPNHIIIDENNVVKIIDFGISIYNGENYFKGYANPHYCSLEQMTGDDISLKSDIYTLGIILYELIYEKKPFDGTQDEIRINKLNNNYIKSDNSSIQMIFDKTINPDVNKRYENVDLLKQDIINIYNNM